MNEQMNEECACFMQLKVGAASVAPLDSILKGHLVGAQSQRGTLKYNTNPNLVLVQCTGYDCKHFYIF